MTKFTQKHADKFEGKTVKSVTMGHISMVILFTDGSSIETHCGLGNYYISGFIKEKMNVDFNEV